MTNPSFQIHECVFFSASPIGRSGSLGLVCKCHVMTERELGILAVFHWHAKHTLEYRHQLTLRWRHDLGRDLRLLPETLPVALLRRPNAVQLCLSRFALTASQEFAERHV